MKWKVVFSQFFTGKLGEERFFKLPTLRFKTFPRVNGSEKHVLELERDHFETQKDRKSFKLTEISLEVSSRFLILQ